MGSIRSRPATGKPLKIICTGCGQRAREAGVAVPDLDFDGFAEKNFMMLEDDGTHPLCEACLIALERAQA